VHVGTRSQSPFAKGEYWETATFRFLCLEVAETTRTGIIRRRGEKRVKWGKKVDVSRWSTTTRNNGELLKTSWSLLSTTFIACVITFTAPTLGVLRTV